MKKVWLCLVWLVLALWGCASGGGTPPVTTVSTTAPTAEPTTPPVTAPETTVPSTTEPEEILEPGWPVTMDGTILPSGTVRRENETLVKWSEAMDALGIADNMWRGEAFTLEQLVEYQGESWVSLAELCEKLEISLFEDTEMAHLYATPGAGDYAVAEGYPVPVLMYHAVGDDIQGEAELYVSTGDLERQLQYLLDNGYSPIWFEDLAQVEQYEKPVILTFDDGYTNQYTELFPLIQKYGVKVTIFAITDAIQWGSLYMKPHQVQQMAASGLVSFQSHTHTHPNLDQLTQEQQREEMEVSKLYLMRLTGKEPFVLSYPVGRQDSTTLAIIGDYYRYGLKMGGECYVTGENPYLLYRSYVSRYTSLERFAEMVDG